jgi:hypothetical protein
MTWSKFRGVASAMVVVGALAMASGASWWEELVRWLL